DGTDWFEVLLQRLSKTRRQITAPLKGGSLRESSPLLDLGRNSKHDFYASS
ncbi:hypothetical protein TNCV_2299011, partial [Trichonephila clavipes]